MPRRVSLVRKVSKYVKTHFLAVVALVFSIVSILITVWWNAEQREQWRAINLGKILVSEKVLVGWKTLSPEEYKAMDFGYSPTISRGANPGTYNYSQEINLCSRLVAFDSEADRNTTAPLAFGYTQVELLERIKALGEKRIRDRHFLVGKEFKIVIAIQKVGTTPARNISFALDIYAWDAGQWRIGEYELIDDLYPEYKILAPMYLTVAIDSELPDQIPFKVRVKYVDAEGKDNSYEINDSVKVER